jgi:hypothetical protein
MDSAQVIEKLSDKLDGAVKEAMPHVLSAFKAQNIGEAISGIFLWILVGVSGFIFWKLYKKESKNGDLESCVPAGVLTALLFIIATAVTCIEGPRVLAAISDPMGAFILKCVTR